MEDIDYNYPTKNNRHSKAQKGKIRELTKKDKKKSNRLSSIERDYLENVGSDDENTESLCINEVELLESLDKLNFTVSDSESIDLEKRLNKKKNHSKVKSDKTVLADSDAELYPVDNFSQFNRDIKLFLKDDQERFETTPAAPEVRRYIHLLGNLYRLKTFSVGQVEDKRIVLEKTHNSGLANNTRQLEKIIEQGNKAIKWCNGEVDFNHKGKSGRKCKKGGNKNISSAKPADGSIVGEKSAPIKEDNVGNQMLQKMGWTPGTGLGRDSSGIINHIPAVVKTKRTGLI